MKPTYKIKRVYVPCCPQCGERLSGNGSQVLPYRCKCGEWEYDSDGEYKIK